MKTRFEVIGNYGVPIANLDLSLEDDVFDCRVPTSETLYDTLEASCRYIASEPGCVGVTLTNGWTVQLLED